MFPHWVAGHDGLWDVKPQLTRREEGTLRCVRVCVCAWVRVRVCVCACVRVSMERVGERCDIDVNTTTFPSKAGNTSWLQLRHVCK
jgi:hypothetical protein